MTRRILAAAVLIAGTIALSAQRAAVTAILMPLEDKTLKRNDYKLTDALHGVRFDLDGDGIEEQVGWTDLNSGLAFLALDRNGNGRIENGKELYCSFTVAGENNGFNALSHDAASVELGVGHRVGLLEQGNPLYDKLLLWTDDNHNGLSEPYELQPLKDLYSSITMAFSESDKQKDKNGNLFYFEGNATIRTAPGQALTPRQHTKRHRECYA